MDRRSCRTFLPDAVSDETVLSLIRAAIQAPSPLNGQPWKFTVITNAEKKGLIADEAARYKDDLIAKSNWKWLMKYDLSMLRTTPVMIVVNGDPSKSGADTIMEGAGLAWRETCGAAIENLMVAATGRGLATLWFTMFDRKNIKGIIGTGGDATVPLAIILLGKPAEGMKSPPRKSPEEVATFIR